ncbi:MAG TPA: M20/M25/M40 family metallo-hydrolase, partial [Candidatus Poseidoniia archaeon]|nr:M20/M25/M40 family metallo-hydrolase [Candidatus Poseidoniia archaeon]HJO28192.1 M20/M25/M40 family metallo-hydrolase [Candidatus Poseidoniia archaeon]
MASAVSGLEPSTLWNNFAALSRIPRPSKQEEQVLAWLQEFADSHGLEWQQDETGNIIIQRPGSGGGESAPVVVIQSHVDMVCEKNSDVEHDFTSDPISLLRDGEWLTADGTTLGADNGIGVATALALLEMKGGAKLPPLECLFTVDEETGLTGAFALDGALLQGRTMLNLDTEEWGAIC